MIVKCSHCGVDFHKKIAEVHRSPHHFCSRDCKGASVALNTVKGFWDKATPNKSGCLEWRGSISRCGYGRARYFGRVMFAHRVAYMLECGEIPAGFCVLHRCDNPRCINPKHLFLGTHEENMNDMWMKGRGNSKINRDDANAIYKSDASNKHLSLKYGLSERTIRHIRTGRAWGIPPDATNIKVSFDTAEEK